MWSGYVVQFWIQWAAEWNVTLNFSSHGEYAEQQCELIFSSGCLQSVNHLRKHWNKQKEIERHFHICCLSVVGDFVNNANSSWQEVLRTPSSWKLIISFAPPGISGSDGICFKLSDRTKAHFEMWHPPLRLAALIRTVGVSIGRWMPVLTDVSIRRY